MLGLKLLINLQYHLRVHEADDTHLPMKAVRQDSKESESLSSDEEESEQPKPEKVEHNLKDPKCQVKIVKGPIFVRNLHEDLI